MITVVSKEDGVSESVLHKVKQLLQTNILLMYESDYPSALQAIISNQFSGAWSVFTLRSVEEYEVLLESKDQTGMIFSYNDVIIILCQAFHDKLNPPCNQDQLDERVQLVHKACVSRGLNLKETCAELQGAIEAGAGPGVTVLVFIENALTQFEYKGAYGELESESVFSISDDKNLRVLVLVTPINDEQIIDEYEQDQEYDIQNNNIDAQNNNFQSGEGEDDYEEPMNTVFRVFEQEQEFKSSSDQLKISFDALEIYPLKLRSFSIFFQLAISPLPKEIKDDLNVLSTGSSLMSKNIIMGINKDSLFFVNFITQQGKLETIYSQMKLKRNQIYQIAVVFNNTELYKELTLYLNGAVQNQVSLTQTIDIPRGYFWIGSEQALKLFKGIVRDVAFVAAQITAKSVRQLYQDLSNSLQIGQIRTTADSIEELLLQQQKLQQNQGIDDNQQDKSTLQYKQPHKSKNSKKTLIPLHLQKTHQVSDTLHLDKDTGSRYLRKTEGQDEIKSERNQKDYIEILSQYLIGNQFLYSRLRELSLNFYWVFTTLQLFAPNFEESEQPKLPFQYLHNSIYKDRFDSYPVYAIELERFRHVVNYAGIQLNIQEIFDIAQLCECGKNCKEFGQYILYDRFLSTCRGATLSTDEIDQLKASYQNDDKEQDQDLILQYNGIHRQGAQPETNFSFFEQLVKLVGNQQEAFKYRLYQMVAYYVQQNTNQIPNVQRLTVVYRFPETNLEVEVEGVEFFQLDDDKVYTQKISISEQNPLKYFRVHYTAPDNQMSMVLFKTETQEETYLFDGNFKYEEGKDATGSLQTYPIENANSTRLSGFRGTVKKINQSQKQLICLQAEYLIKDPEVLKIKKLQPEILPQLPDNWNQGRFQIIVNKHQDSTAHTTTHWPREHEFSVRFNELGAMLKDLFPNIELICNWDQRYSIEHFDVYIRGVGPINKRDSQGRLFLFTKKDKKVHIFMENFSKLTLKIYDEIVLIAQAYGDTIELEKAQNQFLKSNIHLYPPRSKEAQDFPCTVPDKFEKNENETTEKKKRR